MNHFSPKQNFNISNGQKGKFDLRKRNKFCVCENTSQVKKNLPYGFQKRKSRLNWGRGTGKVHACANLVYLLQGQSKFVLNSTVKMRIDACKVQLLWLL